MKNSIKSLLLLVFSISFIRAKNFPIYELPNIVNYRPARDTETLYTIKRVAPKIFTLQKRKLTTGKVIKDYGMKLPQSYPLHVALSADQKSMYMLADVKLVNLNFGLSLFHLDLINDTLSLIRSLPSDYQLAEKFKAGNDIVLIECPYMDPIIIQTKNKKLTKLSFKKKGTPIYYEMDRGGAIISVDTKDSLNDLYFAPFSDPLNMKAQTYQKVCQWQPKFTYSLNPNENLPFTYFVISDSANQWIKNSFEIFRYPTTQMFWADKPHLRQIMNDIPGSLKIEYLDVVDSTFLITIIKNNGLLTDKNKKSNSSIFTLYNIKQPNKIPSLKVPQNVHIALNQIITNGRTFEHKTLSNSPIFNSKIISTRSRFLHSENIVVENKSILGSNSVVPLIYITDLTPHIADEFKISEGTIKAFAEELNKLFEPPMFYSDTFAIKNEENNKWLLSREYTFSNKPAQIITVTVDSTGRILSLHDNLEEK